MKKILISTLLATVCVSAPALAQTAPATTDPETTPGASTMAPAETGNMGTTGMNSGTQSEGGFYTYQEGNQMLGSGLMNARVMGVGGESFGTVNDLLLDREGQVMAVVVGVGGFLGIGEKDVAIANDQLQFVLAEEAAAAAPGATTAPMTGATTAPATGATGTTTAPMTGATTDTAAGTMGTSTVPATGATGTTAMGTNAMAPATGTAGSTDMAAGTAEGYGLSWTGAGIDHIQVNFTREQLEAAPEFETAE